MPPDYLSLICSVKKTIELYKKLPKGLPLETAAVCYELISFYMNNVSEKKYKGEYVKMIFFIMEIIKHSALVEDKEDSDSLIMLLLKRLR